MKDGGTPLHWATSKEIINAMVELGCIVNARNFHGLTALHKMVRIWPPEKVLFAIY